MTAINEVTDYTLEGDVGVITLNSPPVNALSQPVREGLAAGIAAAIADPGAKAVVLICEGRTFIAGADIRGFAQPRAAAGGGGGGGGGPSIENSPKPVVAAIHGTALGGGLETALTCHYRVAVPSAKCGLPEVKLGLLPGGGGTQRLPRVVGVERALEMVTSGEHVPAPECHAMGLIDELVPEGELRSAAVAFAHRIVAEGRPLRRVRDMNEKVEAARGHPEIFANFRKANARKFRGFEAPEANIKCIEAAVNLPFDEGIATERRLFAQLLAGSQSAAQRYAFFAERAANKIPDVPDDTPVIPINKVGVIGGGTMGGGIAMNFMNVGIPVTIVEVRQDALDRGIQVIRRNYERSRTAVPAETEARMRRLTGTLDMNALADCDLVIEAVFERMDIKKDVFTKLDAICKPGAILATNTSGLNVDEIASVTKRPESVIGLHFFSPANVMKLLEIVRADHTSKEVINTCMKLAKRIGKIAVLVGVCPGFVGNRILGARQREANKLIMEGAMPWDVDRVLYDFGFPMGPFAMSDLAGLDIGWVKERSHGQTIRDVLCEMDRRGQKTGAGWYDYDENRNAKPSPVTEKILHDFIVKSGANPRKIGDEEILERCIYPMINEGAKILEEKKAIRASDIDIVWENGYGWPVYRGGPMWYGDQIGPAKVLAKMREFEAQMGAAFKPAALLERVAAEGKQFEQL